MLGSAQVANPEVAKLSSTVHTLVEKGFLDAADAKKLEFRVLNAQGEPSAEQIAEEKSLVAAQSSAVSSQPLADGSHFNRASQKITVQERDIPHFDMSAEEGARSIFLHELGHGIKNSEDVPQLLGQHLGQFDKDSLERAVLDAKSGVFSDQNIEKNTRWGVLAGEMYADCFEVAATAQLKGREAALQNLDATAMTRELDAQKYTGEKERQAETRSSIGQHFSASYLENHRTTKALDALRDQLESGALDNVTSSEQRNALIADAVAKGFTQEYSQVRMAELNVHHLEGDKLVKGLPDGVTAADVLKADVKHPQVMGMGGGLVLAEGVPSDKGVALQQPDMGHTLTGEVALATSLPPGNPVTALHEQAGKSIQDIAQRQEVSAERVEKATAHEAPAPAM